MVATERQILAASRRQLLTPRLWFLGQRNGGFLSSRFRHVALSTFPSSPLIATYVKGCPTAVAGPKAFRPGLNLPVECHGHQLKGH